MTPFQQPPSALRAVPDMLDTSDSGRKASRHSENEHLPRATAISTQGTEGDFAVESWTDEEVVEACRTGSPEEAQACHGELYRRYRRRVAAWCYRISGDAEEAADLAQEVFLRIQERVGSFRGESRFSTWLYTVTRSVAINQGLAAKRRETDHLDDLMTARLEDPSPGAEDLAERGEILDRFRGALQKDLDPLELRVLYLHFGMGVSVRAITELLGLTNRSGAKAQLVSAKRKLERRFGRWLSAQGKRAADKPSATGEFS